MLVWALGMMVAKTGWAAPSTFGNAPLLAVAVPDEFERRHRRANSKRDLRNEFNSSRVRCWNIPIPHHPSAIRVHSNEE